ncbi:hypothetical protein P12053L_04 [Celeribacter phage P12053L]|uniref:Uncharacterized protein n=1 Tax=Celeribacter phage P12053L TaxID=1197951 RepID=I6R9I9_9CAUD|nr:hypothetical protein B622_gp04 [Celeribacter phage P12053L]AFM54609.1 hypothetical protein P12053L_04 [Celeribacter phage P12053L]
MCGEIENCQNEIEKLKESFFTLSFRSETMDRKEREDKLEDVRNKLLDVTHRLNMLLEAANRHEGVRHG